MGSGRVRGVKKGGLVARRAARPNGFCRRPVPYILDSGARLGYTGHAAQKREIIKQGRPK